MEMERDGADAGVNKEAAVISSGAVPASWRPGIVFCMAHCLVCLGAAALSVYAVILGDWAILVLFVSGPVFLASGCCWLACRLLMPMAYMGCAGGLLAGLWLAVHFAIEPGGLVLLFYGGSFVYLLVTPRYESRQKGVPLPAGLALLAVVCLLFFTVVLFRTVSKGVHGLETFAWVNKVLAALTLLLIPWMLAARRKKATLALLVIRACYAVPGLKFIAAHREIFLRQPFAAAELFLHVAVPVGFIVYIMKSSAVAAYFANPKHKPESETPHS